MKRLKRNEGQAAIEFIAVVLVVFFFLLFYLSLAMLMVVSEYVDYATFMAARTYRSGFFDKTKQEQFARQVFNSYMQKIAGIARNPTLEFSAVDPSNEKSRGVTTTFDIDLFYLPPLFVIKGQPLSRIRLKSEAYLGRDPNYQDCIDFFTQFSRRMNLNIEGNGLIRQMEDNGC